MKNRYFALVFISAILLLQGCNPNWTLSAKRPTGLWECEELGITLDLNDAWENYCAEGQMLVDGVLQDIACVLPMSGSTVSICYPDENLSNLTVRSEKEILHGVVDLEGTDKMMLRKYVDGKRTSIRYTFVRVLE